MSEKKSLEIRKSTKIGRKDFWVVDVLPYDSPDDYFLSYIIPNGSRGDYADYPSKLEALDAAKLSGLLISIEPEISIEENTTKTKETNPKYLEGIKKVPLHCIPTGPLFELGLAMLEGSRKYGRHNYRAIGVRASVYYDAATGHIINWWEGEDIDPDSGVHHLIKAMACLLVVRDSMLMGNYNDDRPLRYPQRHGRADFNEQVKGIVGKIPSCVEPYLESNKETR